MRATETGIVEARQFLRGMIREKKSGGLWAAALEDDSMERFRLNMPWAAD
jgi:hypothetical protein